MRITQTLATLLILTTPLAFAAEACQTIHGRAIYYSGDGQLRIWHIGTHHTFRPDDLRTPDNAVLPLMEQGHGPTDRQRSGSTR